MKGIRLFLCLSLYIIVVSCGSNGNKDNRFKIQIKEKANSIAYNQEIHIQIKNPNDIAIDKVNYQIQGNKLTVSNGKVKIAPTLLGKTEITATVHYGEQIDTLTKKITVLSNKAPELFTYEILNTFPHDANAYTQGLEFIGDQLYESTGQYGKSSLREVNFETGETIQKIALDKTLFGEGLTILNDTIIQLTWKSNTGYIYNRSDLKKLASFSYNQSKEGWGLCHDDQHIYKSDGSSKIWLLDKKTLKEKSFIQTVTNTSVFSKANELEFVNGKIYANTYLKDGVMIIDPKTGAIIGVVDLRGLKKKVTQTPNIDVLNGIAYHHQRKSFFVTGKNWDKMFEIRIKTKQ
ncbi:MAG: glutaminyl-peptide cyclotransferase [Flavobacteriaceae bacterium]|nr:glutaminyl-peptide cyclotransferase [Flavobacteriaceae bacterium]